MKIGFAVMKSSYWTIFKTLDLESLEIQVRDNIGIFLRIKEVVKENKLDREVGMLVSQKTFL